MRLIIKKLGDNYVNVNSRDKREGEREREREREREKHFFEQDDIRKKRQTKRCGQKIDSKKLSEIPIRGEVYNSLHQKLYVFVMSRTCFRVNPHSIVA